MCPSSQGPMLRLQHTLRPATAPCSACTSCCPAGQTARACVRLGSHLTHPPDTQVSLALSRAGEVLGVAETPVLLLRRATVPLIDAENFDRRWLLLALFCAPCAALLYLRSPLLPWGLLVGAAAAGAAAAALAGHQVCALPLCRVTAQPCCTCNPPYCPGGGCCCCWVCRSCPGQPRGRHPACMPALSDWGDWHLPGLQQTIALLWFARQGQACPSWGRAA